MNNYEIHTVIKLHFYHIMIRRGNQTFRENTLTKQKV